MWICYNLEISVEEVDVSLEFEILEYAKDRLIFFPHFRDLFFQKNLEHGDIIFIKVFWI